MQAKVQLDDAYLGGERCGGKPGRESEKESAPLPLSPFHMAFLALARESAITEARWLHVHCWA